MPGTESKEIVPQCRSAWNSIVCHFESNIEYLSCLGKMLLRMLMCKTFSVQARYSHANGTASCCSYSYKRKAKVKTLSSPVAQCVAWRAPMQQCVWWLVRAPSSS